MTAKPEGIPGDPIGHIHSRMKAHNDSLSSGSCLDHGLTGSHAPRKLSTSGPEVGLGEARCRRSPSQPRCPRSPFLDNFRLAAHSRSPSANV